MHRILQLQVCGVKILLRSWLHIFQDPVQKENVAFLIKKQEDSDISGTKYKAFSFLLLSLRMP